MSALERPVDAHGAALAARSERDDRSATRAADPIANVPPALAPWRDATLASIGLLAAIGIGSGGFAAVDPALLGYLGATVVAAFGVCWRVSAFWRRPASAFYARALLAALQHPRSLGRVAADAGNDLALQRFIRRRSTMRWSAHLLLSAGALAGFAITIPLVFGWTYFIPAGVRHYRVAVFSLPTLRFDVAGAVGWLFFHALSLAAIAVAVGATYFLIARLRLRQLPGMATGFALAPLLLLLVVALSGLALPASRNWPAAFHAAALVHEAAVIVLLVALPFSRLSHVLVRPLQLGARAVRGADVPRRRCAGCDALAVPAAQQVAVGALLAARGMDWQTHLRFCPSCRRRRVATAQVGMVDAQFQPTVTAAPARRAEVR